MYIFKNRPLCLICSSFLLTSALSYFISGIIKLTALFILTLVAVLFAILSHFINLRIKRSDKFIIILAILSSCIALIISFLYFDIHYKSITEYYDTTCDIEGVVIQKTSNESYYNAYDIKVTSVNGRKEDFKLKLTLNYSSDLEKDDIFTLKVLFSQPQESLNGFKLRRYYKSIDYFICAENAEGCYDEKTGNVFSITGLFSEINQKARKILFSNINKSSASFISGILLGNRDDVSPYIKKDFSKLGLSHILSVSGLHLTVVAGGVYLILKFVTLPKKLSYFILLFVVLFFIGITGFSYSTIRAGLMLILFYTSYLFGKQKDPITSLLLSVTIICIINPTAIINPSLLMSFSATAGIILLGSPAMALIQKIGKNAKHKIIFKPIKYVLTAVTLTLSATVFTLPIIWIFFGETSIISPIANIVFVPLTTLLLYISAIFVVLSIVPIISTVLIIVLNFICSAVINLSSFSAGIAPDMISLKYPFVKYIFILFIVGILLLILLFKIKNPLWLLIPFACCVIVYTICWSVYSEYENTQDRVVFLSEQKNEGFIVRSESQTLVCDMTSGMYGLQTLMFNSFSDLFYDTEADVYMLTHYHKRHATSISKLLQNYYIDSIVIPTPQNEDEWHVAKAIEDIAHEKNIELSYYDNSYTLGSINIEFKRSYIKRSTHPILNAKITNDYTSLVYIGSSAYDSIDNNFIIDTSDADVIIFGMHGPIAKNKINYLNVKSNISEIIFANSSLYDIYEISIPENIPYVTDTNLKEFIFTKTYAY